MQGRREDQKLRREEYLKSKKEDPRSLGQKFYDTTVSPITTQLSKNFVALNQIVRQPHYGDDNIATSPQEEQERAERIKAETRAYNEWKEDKSTLTNRAIDFVKEETARRQEYQGIGGQLASGLVEGLANPINYINPTKPLLNLAFNVAQALTETVYEKSVYQNKNITDYNQDDYLDIALGLGLTVGAHKLTSYLSRTNKKAEVNIKGQTVIHNVKKGELPKQNDLKVSYDYSNNSVVVEPYTIQNSTKRTFKNIYDLQRKQIGETLVAKNNGTKSNIAFNENFRHAVDPLKKQVKNGELAVQHAIARDLRPYIDGNFQFLGDGYDMLINKYEIDYPKFKAIIFGAEENDFISTMKKEYLSINKFSDEGKYNLLINKELLMEKLYNSGDENTTRLLYQKPTTQKINGELVEVPGKYIEVPETEYNGQFRLDIERTTEDYKIKGVNIFKEDPKDLVDVAMQYSGFDEEFLNLYYNEPFRSSVYKSQELEALNNLLDYAEMLGCQSNPTEVLEHLTRNIIDKKSGKDYVISQFYEMIKGSGKRFNNKDFKGKMKYQLKPYTEKNMQTFLEELNKQSIHIRKPKYKNLDFSQKTLMGLRDLANYKYLFSLNGLGESTSNSGLINQAKIDLYGGDLATRINIFESSKEMLGAAKKAFSDIRKLRKTACLGENLDLMDNIILDYFIETALDFEGSTVGKIGKKLSETGSYFQFISDIQRKTLSIASTSKDMFNILSEMDYDNLTKEMKFILKNNGVDNKNLFDNFKTQIKSYGTEAEFLEAMLDKEHLSLVKTVFDTCTEYAGKDILPKVIGTVEGASSNDGVPTKILKTVYTTYKRYGLARLERIFKKVTQQIDDDLIIRNRFNRDLLSKSGIKKVAELGKTGVSLWATMSAARWAGSKITGGTTDDIIECKLDAMLQGDLPLFVSEALIQSTTLDFMGGSALWTPINGSGNLYTKMITEPIKAYQRAEKTDLTKFEKVGYLLLYSALPNIFARGIDNQKFEKQAPNTLVFNTKFSKDLWNEKYKNNSKEFFTKTNWFQFFVDNPKQADKIFSDVDGIPKENRVAIAGAFMETTEGIIRDNTLNDILSNDDAEEMHQELEEYRMDLDSLIDQAPEEVQELFIKLFDTDAITEYRYKVLAMDTFNNAKTKDQKIKALQSIVNYDNIYLVEQIANKL